MRLKELLKSAKDSDQPKRRPGRPKESLKNGSSVILMGCVSVCKKRAKFAGWNFDYINKK